MLAHLANSALVGWDAPLAPPSFVFLPRGQTFLCRRHFIVRDFFCFISHLAGFPAAEGKPSISANDMSSLKSRLRLLLLHAGQIR